MTICTFVFKIYRNISYFYSYSLDIPETQSNILVSLSITHCIDKTCEAISIFDRTNILIPVCNGSIAIPGNGTIAGFIDALDGHVGPLGVIFVTHFLGFDVRKF